MSQIENKVEEPQAPKIDQELVDKATKELEAFVEETKNKVYPIKVEDQDNLEEIIFFIENDAPWKNMEAIGIMEVSKSLRAERLNGIKSGNIFLPSLAIQALSFFLAKVEKKGIDNAEKHIKMVRPVDDALKLIKADNDKLNRLQSELAAAENGIEIEKTDKTEDSK